MKKEFKTLSENIQGNLRSETSLLVIPVDFVKEFIEKENDLIVALMQRKVSFDTFLRKRTKLLGDDLI